MTYARYLFRQLAWPTVLITLGLSGVIWLTQSLRFMDFIVNKGLNVGAFVYFTLLLLPSLLGIALPIALFCAVLYMTHKLQAESEFTVLQSAGLDRHALVTPALRLGAIVAAAGYAVSLYFQPLTYQKFRALQYEFRNDLAAVVLQEGVFHSPIEGLTLYVRSRRADGWLSGILVHDARKPDVPGTLIAQKGRLLMETGEAPRLLLVNGNRQQIDPKTGQLSLLRFGRYLIDVSMIENLKEQRFMKPKEAFLNDLLFPDTEMASHRQRQFLAEGHYRLTWPLIAPALVLIGFIGMTWGEFNRRRGWKPLVFTVLGGLALIALMIGLRSLATKTPWLAPLMYALPLSVTGGGWWYLKRE